MPSNHLFYAAWQVFQDHTTRLFSGGRFVNILFVLAFVTTTMAYIKGYDIGFAFLLLILASVFRYAAMFYLFHLVYQVRDESFDREELFQSLTKVYTEDIHKRATWLLTYYDNYLNPTKEEGKE